MEFNGSVSRKSSCVVVLLVQCGGSNLLAKCKRQTAPEPVTTGYGLTREVQVVSTGT